MSKLPPVPEENRSHKGPGDDNRAQQNPSRKPRRENLKEQGRQGNIEQNTTNQGYQQDR
jgi:hypothetical protein